MFKPPDKKRLEGIADEWNRPLQDDLILANTSDGLLARRAALSGGLEAADRLFEAEAAFEGGWCIAVKDVE